ncbi:MAG: hypothetical protein Q4F34_02140 [Prevotellaceae bacterium]|nr:hypothetical protein [Prevotellaceae bacterium]
MVDSTKRAVVNTFAQYTRAIINIALSFYSTRLILQALGQDDYGIYSLIAGVVFMLAYITNALVTTTQRYLSYYNGKNDFDYLKKVFTNSLFIHVVFAGVICIIMLALTKPMITQWLVIDSGRHEAAEFVYVMAIVMLFFTVMTSPFKAVFISRENIVYISIIEVCDGILKFALAIYLLHADLDKLMLYAIIMAGIQIFTFVAFAVYGKWKYDECRLAIYFKDLERQCMKQLLGFAGWTIYGTGCVVVRTQGLAVVLNRFFGIIYNAAYGIAQQVTGAILFLSLSIINALSPQIIKAEGSKDREKMLHLSECLSKYSYLILSLIGIPLMFEMNAVLEFWLKDIPDAAVSFCRFILLASICDQLTIGLGTAIQATGKIRVYTLVTYTTKVLTLPAMCLALYLGADVHATLWLYVIFEAICVLMRLPFAKQLCGLSMWQYIKNVFIPVIIPTICISVVGWVMLRFVDMQFRFLVTIPLCAIIGAIAIWFCVFDANDKERIIVYTKTKLKLSR